MLLHLNNTGDEGKQRPRRCPAEPDFSRTFSCPSSSHPFVIRLGSSPPSQFRHRRWDPLSFKPPVPPRTSSLLRCPSRAVISLLIASHLAVERLLLCAHPCRFHRKIHILYFSCVCLCVCAPSSGRHAQPAISWVTSVSLQMNNKARCSLEYYCPKGRCTSSCISPSFALFSSLPVRRVVLSTSPLHCVSLC